MSAGLIALLLHGDLKKSFYWQDRLWNLNYTHRSILRGFAPQGRHVTPMQVRSSRLFDARFHLGSRNAEYETPKT